MIIKVNYTVSDIYMSTSVSPVYIKVVYSGTSGGGTWGTITGTLSAQTDLQAALDLKVPTSRTLTINGVAFDLSANRAWTIDALPSQTGNSGKYLTTNGTAASWGTINLTGYVPYTGATGAVNLGAFGITAASLIKSGGTSSQFLKADGSVDSSTYYLASNPSGYTSNLGTVTSVGLSMPSAFSVASSPITSSGTIAVTGAGLASQYVRGDGTLANFPTSTGGGSSFSYYLNGSVAQGTIGGVAFKQMSKTPVIGAGTDFTISADGYIQSFITDAGDPALLNIPVGNWNFEMYFSASSAGGSPSFYLELYKWNGTTLSLIATNSATPEVITNGTTIDLYTTALAVPATTLLSTDRLAIRVYVIHSSKTITLHTEDSHLCEIITTFSTGLTALNGLTAQVQNFATGTSGTDFAISSSTSTHTFNLPTASAINRGALSSSDWSIFNGKESALTFSSPLSRATNTISIPVATTSVNGYLSSTDWTTFNNKQAAITLTTTGTSGAATLVGSTLNIPQYSGGGGGMAIGGSITSATAGSILFAGTSGVLAQNNSNLFWDNTNNRLGIGTSTPTFTLDVNGNSRVTGTFRQKTSGGSNYFDLVANADGSNPYITAFKSGSLEYKVEFGATIGASFIVGATVLIGNSSGTAVNAKVGGLFAATSAIESAGGVFGLSSTTNNYIVFQQSGSSSRGTIGFATGTSYLQIRTGAATNLTDGTLSTVFFTSGNVSIGTSTTDAGFKLDVNGTARVSGKLSVGTPSAASAVMEVTSTTQGFLPPRMTTSERNAIASPATGLVVYDTTLNAKCFYDGATWRTDDATIITNRQTASYSLILSDRGKLVEMNSASANTLTVPLNSSIAFPIGSKIDVTQYGAGATTITATSGVTIRSFTSYLKLAGQYAACTLVKIGTDEWYCYGNLIA